MALELFYTSAPQGLQSGSRGFCTVAATRGMSANLIGKLESLSGYRPLFSPHDPRASLNPVVWSHVRLMIAGRPHHVLSRIGPAPADYTERASKFAHHVVLETDELATAGPAWMLSQPGFMETEWDGQVRLLDTGRQLPAGDAPVTRCRAWEQMTGDAGWAGTVAEAFQEHPERPVNFLFDPGMELLSLIHEALSLLPAKQRWAVAFNTYYTSGSKGTSCHWRGIPRQSAEAKAAENSSNALTIDLGGKLEPAVGGTLGAMARGEMSSAAARQPQRLAEASPQVRPSYLHASRGRAVVESGTFANARAMDAERPFDMDASGLLTHRYHTMIVTRSWINATPQGLLIGLEFWNTLTEDQKKALRRLQGTLWLLASDRGTTSADDGRYRLFTGALVRWSCDGMKLCDKKLDVAGSVGSELVVEPHPGIFDKVEFEKIDDSSARFGYRFRGKPHFLAEVFSFWPVKFRLTPYIWHWVSGIVRCEGDGQGGISINLEGSQFPNHTLFANGKKYAEQLGSIVTDLWNPHPHDPGLIAGGKRVPVFPK